MARTQTNKLKRVSKKTFDKKEFVYWAKKARVVIERVAKEREKYEKSSNLAL